MSDSRRPAESTISQNVWDRSHKTSWLKSGQFVWVFCKGFLLTPLQEFSKGLPISCLWWGSSSDVPAASLSPDHGKVASQLGEWHCCLTPEEGTGSANAVGQGFAGAGSLIVVDSWGEMAKRAARDMFPISNWRGYISTPQASGGADL